MAVSGFASIFSTHPEEPRPFKEGKVQQAPPTVDRQEEALQARPTARQIAELLTGGGATLKRKKPATREEPVKKKKKKKKVEKKEKPKQKKKTKKKNGAVTGSR